MLKHLGKIIEKKPWLVIAIVLIVTLGFSILIPSIEIKTDFNDFMPDDEIVQAQSRIIEYFGENQQIMFLYAEKKYTDDILTVDSLREQFYIQEKLLEIPQVEQVLGLPFIIDQICQLEYGRGFKNCSDAEIKTALDDLLEKEATLSLKIFDEDDPNEEIDCVKYPRISDGFSADEADIKNCYIDYKEENIEFSIEVYSLERLEDKIRSPLSITNVFEWYLEFENQVQPDERLNLSYRLSAHIEPTHPIWEIGKGALNNIKLMLERLYNEELIYSYKLETFLWIKPFDETMYFPLKLDNANTDILFEENTIKIIIPHSELKRYGIATSFGEIHLPAKLTNFKAGVRYYQTNFLKLPWLRLTVDTDSFIERIEKIRQKPILNNLAEIALKYSANLTWKEFDMLFNMLTFQGESQLPEYFALKDVEKRWVTGDKAPNEKTSDNVFFIRPYFIDDLEIAAEAFLPRIYSMGIKPDTCLMIVSSNVTPEYETNLGINNNIIEQISFFDSDYDFVTFKSTGQGVISTQINEVTQEANMIIVPMIFFVIISILFVSFRRVSYVVIPLFSLVVSTIWLFGTMVLLDIAFTTIAVALVPLIMGLGVDYSVHLSHDYRLELSKGKTPAEAIKKSILEIGNAMFLAMLTTVIAFLSFLSASLPPIRDFGLLLALGIIYTFITAITLQAAIRYLIDRKEKDFKKIKKHSFKLNILMGKLSNSVLSHKKKIIASIIIITIVAGFGASQIKTGFDFDSFIPESNPARQLLEKIEEEYPFSSQDQEYILIEGRVSSRVTLKGIKQTHNKIKDDEFAAKNADGSLKTTSIYSIIEQAVNNNDSLVEKFNLDSDTKIPKTSDDVKNLFDYLYNSLEYGSLTKSVIHKDRNGEYDASLIRVYVNIITEGREAEEVSKDLELLYSDLENDLVDYGTADGMVTGGLIITYSMTKSLTRSQLISTGLSVILAAIVLIIAYRRPILGLITIIPVLVSMVWILGTMYFIGYDLNILTITVTSLTIGIGIDYAIHATERFKIVAGKTGDIDAAVCETISKTGGALLIAALTTALGFIVLVFAPIPPQVQFGVITAITITYSFITSVLLLPLVLAKWAKWRKKTKGFIITPEPPEKDYFEEIDSCKSEE